MITATWQTILFKSEHLIPVVQIIHTRTKYRANKTVGVCKPHKIAIKQFLCGKKVYIILPKILIINHTISEFKLIVNSYCIYPVIKCNLF